MHNKFFSEINPSDAILALAENWHKSDHQDPRIDKESFLGQPRNYEKNRYHLGKKFPDIYFTAQEAKYIYYAIKGFSNKKIAQLMQLSPRTLTYYCDNIRRKIPCRNRKALINIILSTEFMNYLPKVEKLLGINFS